VTAQAEYATAVALTTGTFTPVPTQYVTPMVIPAVAAGSSMRQPSVARIAEATATAQAGGPTFTPLPYNAVIGEYVIATPTPQNVATAAALAVGATADAGAYGTATACPSIGLIITPTPEPLPTATPTIPPVIMAEDFTPTPTPTATEIVPATLPDQYKNLIFFQRGAGPTAQTYLFNPDDAGDRACHPPVDLPARTGRSLTLSPDGQREGLRPARLK
jgi:hypothetical protein